MSSIQGLNFPICALPISPTYSPTHRYLFYTSLLLSITYPTPPPLVKGAFAFSLTYSATAALYGLLLLSNSRSAAPSDVTLTNLDLLALNSILGVSAISILPLLTWTMSLSRAARNILRIWGLFITIGFCAVFAQFVRSKNLSTLQNGLNITHGICQSQPWGKLKLRNPHDAVTIDFERLFDRWFIMIVKKTSFLIFTPLLFGALACFVTIRAENTKKSDISDLENLYTIDEYASESGLGATSSSTKEFSFRRLYLVIRNGVLHLTPVCWITIVVINEMYLLRAGGLPEIESMGEVGQWGVLAGLGFVAAAATWNEAVNDGESGTTSVTVL